MKRNEVKRNQTSFCYKILQDMLGGIPPPERLNQRRPRLLQEFSCLQIFREFNNARANFFCRDFRQTIHVSAGKITKQAFFLLKSLALSPSFHWRSVGGTGRIGLCSSLNRSFQLASGAQILTTLMIFPIVG